MVVSSVFVDCSWYRRPLQRVPVLYELLMYCLSALTVSRQLHQSTHPASERGDRPRGRHEAVEVVDALHVLHDTEGRVPLDVIGLIEPRRDGLVEGPDCSELAASETQRMNHLPSASVPCAPPLKFCTAYSVIQISPPSWLWKFSMYWMRLSAVMSYQWMAVKLRCQALPH